MPLPIAHLLISRPAASYAARSVGSSLLAGALARDLWKRIPEWIRQDIGFRDLLKTNDNSTTNNFDDGNASGGNDDEMASLIAVIQKLQALVTIGYEKLGSEHKRQRRRRKVVRLLSSTNNSNIAEDDSTTISTLEFHLALLAYIQLCNQIKLRYPEWRDEMYDRYLPNDHTQTIGYSNLLDELSSIPRDDCSLDTAGTTRTGTAASPVTEDQIEELIQYLEFSTMAYETNEELLKSQLHENGGYQLLLHRTTSSVVDAVEQGNNAGEDETMDKREQQLPTKNKNRRRKPPGRVGYYVAISPSENKLLIGIKGTSTIEELLTDCCGRAVRCDLENDPHSHVIDALDNDCSIGDEESDNYAGNSVQFSGSNDNDDKGISVLPENIADEDESCSDEILDSNFDDLLEAIDQAETTRAVCDVYNDSDNGISKGSSSSSSYEYFELRTNDNDHEAVEVELLIDNNPKETGKQRHQRSTKRDSHPSENILLLPSRFDEVNESRNLQRLLHGLPTSATVSTIEDNGIEMQPHRSTKLRGAHEGILHSAQQLLQEISPLIEEYAVSKGFDVVCCGHSLGAAAAALLTILIRGKYASLVSPFDTRGESQRVRAYAFAPPPLLDRLSSLACRHYVTSVVNNSDIIPRSSLTNLDVLMTVLEAVICALTEASMNPGGSAATNKPILASLSLFRKLSEGTSGKLLIEPRELKRIQKEAIYEATSGDGGLDEYYWNMDGDHHLLVPGKVLLLYQKWGKKELAARPHNGDGAMECNAYNAVWTNGTVKMLKGFELGGEAISDHLTVSYFNALKCCLKDPFNNVHRIDIT